MLTATPTRSTHSLDLPPPFRLVTLREAGEAFAHAIAIASEAGAGTLVQVGRFDTAEFAVVLEPEQPLRLARCVQYVGLCALGDALAARVPPRKTIGFEWPDAILVNGAPICRVRLGWPARANESEPPEWLVLGASVRMAAMDDAELGLPFTTALEDEGFDDVSAGHLIESFARHLMAHIAIWHEYGFDAIAKSYRARLSPDHSSLFDIDQNGDLVTTCRTGTRASHRRSLADALADPCRTQSRNTKVLRGNRRDDPERRRPEHTR